MWDSEVIVTQDTFTFSIVRIALKKTFQSRENNKNIANTISTNTSDIIIDCRQGRQRGQLLRKQCCKNNNNSNNMEFLLFLLVIINLTSGLETIS